MASPATYNQVVPQATTYQFAFQIQDSVTGPWNLTNYNATMTVRPFAGSSTTTLLATNSNGKIVLDVYCKASYNWVRTVGVGKEHTGPPTSITCFTFEHL